MPSRLMETDYGRSLASDIVNQVERLYQPDNKRKHKRDSQKCPQEPQADIALDQRLIHFFLCRHHT